MDKTKEKEIEKLIEEDIERETRVEMKPVPPSQLDRIERKLDGMYWVLVERMINEMAIELLRHVEFIKRKPTIKIEDAKDALRKIYSKYQGKHEKNVRTL